MSTPTRWPEVAVDAIDMARAARTLVEELGHEHASDLATELTKTVLRLDRADADDVGRKLENLVWARTDIEVRVRDLCPDCDHDVLRRVDDVFLDEHSGWCPNVSRSR